MIDAEEIIDINFEHNCEFSDIREEVISIIKKVQNNAIEITINKMNGKGIMVAPSDLYIIKEELFKQIK